MHVVHSVFLLFTVNVLMSANYHFDCHIVTPVEFNHQVRDKYVCSFATDL